MAKRKSVVDRLDALSEQVGKFEKKPDAFTVQKLRPSGKAFIYAMSKGDCVCEMPEDSRLGKILLAAREHYKHDRPTEISVTMSLNEVREFWEKKSREQLDS